MPPTCWAQIEFWGADCSGFGGVNQQREDVCLSNMWQKQLRMRWECIHCTWKGIKPWLSRDSWLTGLLLFQWFQWRSHQQLNQHRRWFCLWAGAQHQLRQGRYVCDFIRIVGWLACGLGPSSSHGALWMCFRFRDHIWLGCLIAGSLVSVLTGNKIQSAFLTDLSYFITAYSWRSHLTFFCVCGRRNLLLYSMPSVLEPALQEHVYICRHLLRVYNLPCVSDWISTLSNSHLINRLKILLWYQIFYRETTVQ